jgi:hypothetical protein
LDNRILSGFPEIVGLFLSTLSIGEEVTEQRASLLRTGEIEFWEEKSHTVQVEEAVMDHEAKD